MNFGKSNHARQEIFIVEDNAMCGKSLKAFIQTKFPEINDIKIFSTGEACLKELDQNPLVVIVDYFLNSKHEQAQNGVEIIKQIKSQKPPINLIILSSQDSPGVIMETIRDCDCKYIQKDEDSFQHIEKLIKKFLIPKATADNRIGYNHH